MDLHAITADDLRAMDRRRFEESVAVHEPRLLGRIGLMVRDPQDDLVQETLVRAWQSWSTLRPDQLGPWLDVVASRLALNEIRRRRRLPWTRLGDHDLPAQVTVDPDLWAALAELRRDRRSAASGSTGECGRGRSCPVGSGWVRYDLGHRRPMRAALGRGRLLAAPAA